MSLEQIQDFLDASQEFRFEGRGREETFEWVKKTLVGQQYHIQGKAEKGLLKSYLGKMTGLSRAQMTRLIGQYLDKESIAEKLYSRRRFPSVRTPLPEIARNLKCFTLRPAERYNSQQQCITV